VLDFFNRNIASYLLVHLTIRFEMQMHERGVFFASFAEVANSVFGNWYSETLGTEVRERISMSSASTLCMVFGLYFV